MLSFKPQNQELYVKDKIGYIKRNPKMNALIVTKNHRVKQRIFTSNNSIVSFPFRVVGIERQKAEQNDNSGYQNKHTLL